MKTSKILFSSLLFIFAIAFTACQSDDPADLIVGTWEYSNVSVDVQTSNPILTTFLKESFSEEYGAESASYTFNADGTALLVSYYEEGEKRSEKGVYKIENKKLFFAEDKDELAKTKDEDGVSFTVSKKSLQLIVYDYSSESLSSIAKAYEKEYGKVTISKLAIVMNLKKK